MRKRSNARVMWELARFVSPFSPWVCLAVACGVAGFCCATAIPVIAAGAAVRAAAVGSLFALAPVAWLLAALAVARGVLHFIEQRCNHYIAFRLLAHIRSLVFGKLRELAPAKLSGADRGSLISTATSDVELLEVYFAHTVSPVCIAVLMAAIMAIYLGCIHPALAAVALLGYAVVGIAVPVAVSRASGADGRASRDQAAGLSGFVLDGLRGLSEVLQFGAGQRRLAELDRLSGELVDTQGRLRGVAGQGQTFTSGIIMVVSVAQMLLALSLSAIGQVDGTGCVLATVATFSSFGPFVALANLGSTLQGTLAAGNRVLDILEEEPQVEDVSEGGVRISKFTGAAAEGVSFSYGAGATAEGGDADALDAAPEKILDDVSIEVEPGQIVAIQGRSGSGKSTLCRLLMRFWDVDEGRVSISGADVRGITTGSLRDMEAFVEQDTHLFHDSIRYNLLLAKPDATDAELEAACRAASVHDFIMSLPDGYDTMVGELGDTLSGGERQRLGLARAFLHDAQLLLLDEPTSNLDALNEAQVLRSLDEQRGKRAVVLISHRPSTSAIADKTYSMDSGRVS
ncbi:ABC transporter ATP-binding protein [Paratractidigestivibacter sp.]|uniref:amino acid ABC transporter ATP-binding/permease protein n=1 Tax=Paratractidigestivibacter sp. TaxID=2847316 RepID=UPI002AC93D05|nr:ABC transporter ATP-binding protein [Paratractidigestivibacter sp.]